MLIYKIFGFAFLLAGFGMVFGAKFLVKRYGWNKKVICTFESELSDKELENYKLMKASVNVKVIGVLVSLPGLILTVMAFK